MKEWAFETEDGSYFLKALCAFALAGIAIAAVWIAIDVHRAAAYPSHTQVANATYPSAPHVAAPAPPKPLEITKTVAIMPTQYFDLPNHRFRKIEIHSTFPIRVLSGSCRLNYGVEFYCDSDPADVFITDMRKMPVFAAPQGNQIAITATEY